MKLWWLRLGVYAQPQWHGLLFVTLMMLLGVVLDVLKPWPLKLIVDYVLTGQSLPDAVSWINLLPGSARPTVLLGWLAIATIMLFLASRIAWLMQGYVQTGVGARMVYGLGAALFEHLQRLSLCFHGRRSTGDLVRRVTTDSTCGREMMMGVYLPVLTSLVSLGAMFTVMWQLDHFLSLLAIFVALPLGVVIRLFIGTITERMYEQQNLEGEMMAIAEQTLTAMPVVQAFSRDEYEKERFYSMSQSTLKAYLRVLTSNLKLTVSVGSITAVGTAAIMLIGGFHVMKETMTVGSLIVFLTYLASLYAPMENLASVSSSFASASAKAKRVLEVMDKDEKVWDDPAARPLPVHPEGKRGHIRLEGITFGYEPGRTVLQDVTLEARPGETIAIVGKTGAGKSTLVSLIPRFFDPWQGRVMFDGVDIREVQISNLRAQVALVLQEPFLLPLTVAQNIAYGRPGAVREEILEAAFAANADEFIRKLPQEYDTVIGEKGATLSEGQKQRLAIARALLKDAPVLILDEPTSALDAHTETLLLGALDILMKGRTTFIIAHRLSTIQGSDRIVVMEKGRVIEAGTHHELLKDQGSYYQLATYP